MECLKIRSTFIPTMVLIALAVVTFSPSYTLAAPRTPTINEQQDVSTPDASLPSNQQLSSILKVVESMANQEKLIEAVVPMLARAVTTPITNVAEGVNRALLLAGVSSYLLVPTLASSATTIKPIVRRFVDPSTADSIVQEMTTFGGMEPLIARGLELLGMQSDDCKAVISCRAGKAIGRDFPTISKFLAQASQGYQSSYRFSRILIDAMEQREDCPSDCPALANMEKYWKELEEKDVTTVAREALKDAISNALASISMNALNSSATNLMTRDAANINQDMPLEMTRRVLETIHLML